jgi:hypothetical protein
MAFGEEYQDMTDRMILIELACDLKAIKGEVAELREQVGNIKCPSPRCHDHEQRISKLEDHEKIVVGVLSAVAVGSGVLVWVLTQVFGG